MRLSGSYFFKAWLNFGDSQNALRDVQNVTYSSRLLNGVTGWKSLTYNTLYFVLKLKS